LSPEVLIRRTSWFIAAYIHEYVSEALNRDSRFREATEYRRRSRIRALYRIDCSGICVGRCVCPHPGANLVKNADMPDGLLSIHAPGPLGSGAGDALDLPRPRARTLLVVDDQEVNRLILARHLELLGHRVITAENGPQALERVREHKVDGVVLDVVMQGMDGFEVCRRLKADPATWSITVVMVTVLNNQADRVRAMEAGADEFLSKPVYPEELNARIRSLMRWREAREALEEARLGQMRRLFSRYLCPELVEDLLASSDGRAADLLNRSERREAVVMFADLRGFTCLAEQLAADRVVELLNGFFAMAIGVAHAHQGTVFSMAGDGLLVGFGVPLAQPDAADRAFDCARGMHRGFRDLRDQWQDEWQVESGLGIGINRGEVVVGNVGSEAFMSYTVVGDPVNVADRLQKQAGPGEILLSGRVHEALAPERASACERLDNPLFLKGRTRPLPVLRWQCKAAAGPDA
jgi:adenylate cyclase